MRYLEERHESEITCRAEAFAEAEDGSCGEGEGGESFQIAVLNAPCSKNQKAIKSNPQ
jgi:hypothetical protein